MLEMKVENVMLNIKATNLELTDKIRDYIEKRITKFGKLLHAEQSDVYLHFEVAKITGQQKGDVYRADCNVEISGNTFYAHAEKEDIFTAIDAVKNKLYKEIRRDKNKHHDLFRRGGAAIKKMLRFNS